LEQYTMSRRIFSVTDVWREYVFSFNGSPSIQSLENKYGTAWRKYRKESRFFSRRKELYDAINERAELENISPEEAAQRME
ncbi:hypothetical protein PHYBLDRAFT_95102, partial [Phycomyces blakesleeanus NRRL 1555(-)]